MRTAQRQGEGKRKVEQKYSEKINAVLQGFPDHRRGLLSHNPSGCVRLHGHMLYWQICLSAEHSPTWQLDILTAQINF